MLERQRVQGAPGIGIGLISTVPGADKGLQKAFAGPVREVYTPICLEKGEEESQSLSNNMLANVFLPYF